MLNIIKADLYRLFISRAFYITLILFLMFVILQTATGSTSGLIAVSYSDTTQTTNGGDIISEDIGNRHEYDTYTGIIAPFEVMGNPNPILYFLLSFIIITAAFDFSTGTVKNAVTNGISRVKYYLSKITLSFSFCLSLMAIAGIISTIIATVMRGFGGTFDTEFIVKVLKVFGAQSIILFAIVCVVIFFVFAIKNTAAIIGVYLAFSLLPQIVILILASSNNKLEFLFNYDLFTSAKRLASIDYMTSASILNIFAIGTFYIIVSIIGGILLFRKGEVK